MQQRPLAGYKLHRQHSVGHYILDSCCPAARLAIELDGDAHFTDEAMAYDRERTGYLNAPNMRVPGVHNRDVYDRLDAVCAKTSPR